MTTAIRVSREGASATVWFDGPLVKNALGQSAWESVPGALAQVASFEGVRMIVLRGVGGFFGAGADVGGFRESFSDRDKTRRYFDAIEAAMSAIEDAPLPTLAAIEGGCFGAAVAVALACDVRIADPEATFAVTPARLGIIYPYGDVGRLVAAVGARRAKALMLGGRAIDAGTALAYGLVDEIVPGAMDKGIAARVGDVERCSPSSITETRRAICRVADGVDANSAGYPAALLDAVERDEFREGLDAFMSRRRAQF